MVQPLTRTFIALELDASQQRLLGGIIAQGRQVLPDLKWVDPSGIHLTVAFLGELSNQQLVKARAAAEQAAAHASPFRYSLSGLGIFGPPQAPRVLWMGIAEPTGTLNTLHQDLAHALEAQGFSLEKRAFAPHLTLARVKSALNAAQLRHLQQLLAQYQAVSSAYRVTQLAIMKSERLPQGARYTCLATCQFGA